MLRRVSSSTACIRGQVSSRTALTASNSWREMLSTAAACAGVRSSAFAKRARLRSDARPGSRALLRLLDRGVRELHSRNEARPALVLAVAELAKERRAGEAADDERDGDHDRRRGRAGRAATTAVPRRRRAGVVHRRLRRRVRRERVRRNRNQRVHHRPRRRVAGEHRLERRARGIGCRAVAVADRHDGGARRSRVARPERR